MHTKTAFISVRIQREIICCNEFVRDIIPDV